MKNGESETTIPVHKPMTVSDYVNLQVRLSEKTHRSIAKDMGYRSAHMISMMKSGDARMPWDKIVPFSRSLGIDPLYMMTLCIKEYMPNLWNDFESFFGQPLLTTNELEFIKILRASGKVNPKLNTAEERQEFASFIASLRADGDPE